MPSAWPRILLFASACLLACSGEEPSPDAARDSTTSAPVAEAATWDSASVAGLTCEGLERTLLRSTLTRADMAQAFGPPDSLVVTTEPNRHVEGATDSLFAVHYPGLMVTLRTPQDGFDMATSAVVRDNRYLRYPAIGIGAPEERVVSVLGIPSTRDSAQLVYACNLEIEEPVTFFLSDGRVVRVEIAYYVD